MTEVAGVGPDAPTATNDAGARQSVTLALMDQAFPWLGALKVGEVIQGGMKKYGRDNWRGLSQDEILNHVVIHLGAYFAGDKSDDHLAHAACRVLMALDISLDPARSLYLFKNRPGDPPLVQ